jgi:NSS family neurotransmitter:Na+ symporter
VTCAGFLLGIPSALWVGFLGNQDFVWGVALMISGAFVAFAVIRAGLPGFRRASIDGIEGDWNAGRVWDFAISRLVPAQAVVLLVWWLYLSATEYAPDTWYDPFDPYSVMTCLVQWGAAAAVLIGLNRWLVSRTGRQVPTERSSG